MSWAPLISGWYNNDLLNGMLTNAEIERTNFAFKPNIVDSKLKLNSAIELEVLETYYDTPIINKNPLTLSVAKVRIIKQSKAIAEDGKIVWDKIGC